MTNFESGPTNLHDDGTELRWEDAAKQVTVTGWSCVKCNRFYGDDERAARYCCHTSSWCECLARKKRHQIKCEECYHKAIVQRWDNLEQVDSPSSPSPSSPLTTLDGDTYFFDEETLLEHCHEQNISPSDMFLVLCKRHNPNHFSLYDICEDYLPEDHDLPGSAQEISAVETAVNGYLQKHEPWSWVTDYKRRPTDANLAALDAKYTKGAD